MQGVRRDEVEEYYLRVQEVLSKKQNAIIWLSCIKERSLKIKIETAWHLSRNAKSYNLKEMEKLGLITISKEKDKRWIESKLDWLPYFLKYAEYAEGEEFEGYIHEIPPNYLGYQNVIRFYEKTEQEIFDVLNTKAFKELMSIKDLQDYLKFQTEHSIHYISKMRNYVRVKEDYLRNPIHWRDYILRAICLILVCQAIKKDARIYTFFERLKKNNNPPMFDLFMYDVGENILSVYSRIHKIIPPEIEPLFTYEDLEGIFSRYQKDLDSMLTRT